MHDRKSQQEVLVFDTKKIINLLILLNNNNKNNGERVAVSMHHKQLSQQKLNINSIPFPILF